MVLRRLGYRHGMHLPLGRTGRPRSSSLKRSGVFAALRRMDDDPVLLCDCGAAHRCEEAEPAPARIGALAA